jgi:hypothetical protein
LLLLVGVDLHQLEAAAVAVSSFSSSGPITLQGPHQGAQKSTSTGFGGIEAAITSVQNFQL